MTDYPNGWNRGQRFALGGSDEARHMTDEQLAGASGRVIDLEREARAIERACCHEPVEIRPGLVICRMCPATRIATASARTDAGQSPSR